MTHEDLLHPGSMINFNNLPIEKQSGGLLVGITLPYSQVALLPPLFTWSAGQMSAISDLCLTGKVGFVSTSFHDESRILHSDYEITIRYYKASKILILSS